MIGGRCIEQENFKWLSSRLILAEKEDLRETSKEFVIRKNGRMGLGLG